MAGVVEQLIRERFGGADTDTRDNPLSQTSIGTSAVRVLPGNPDRLALIITNLSTNNVFAGWFEDVASTKGVWVPASGGSLIASWDEDFDRVAREWYAVASDATSAIFVSEVIAI